MSDKQFNKFHRYNELTRLLRGYVREYPNLIRLKSIGKSYEGQDVWLVAATNFKSGSDAEKSAQRSLIVVRKSTPGNRRIGEPPIQIILQR